MSEMRVYTLYGQVDGEDRLNIARHLKKEHDLDLAPNIQAILGRISVTDFGLARPSQTEREQLQMGERLEARIARAVEENYREGTSIQHGGLDKLVFGMVDAEYDKWPNKRVILEGIGSLAISSIAKTMSDLQDMVRGEGMYEDATPEDRIGDLEYVWQLAEQRRLLAKMALIKAGLPILTQDGNRELTPLHAKLVQESLYDEFGGSHIKIDKIGKFRQRQMPPFTGTPNANTA